MTIGHVRHLVVKRRFTLSPNQDYGLDKIVMQARPGKR
jgi:hypothetical protein